MTSYHSSLRHSYLLGNDDIEVERLNTRLPAVDRGLLWIMTEVGQADGWEVLEVGCGPRGAIVPLADWVGPAGRVIGLERDPRFATEARKWLDRRRVRNADIVVGNALSPELPASTFDLVYAERVIVNLPDAEHVLNEMVRLARPGGIVALIEPDVCTQDSDPAHSSFSFLMNVYQSEIVQSGRWGPIGRRLPSLLQAAGLVGVKAAAHVDVLPAGSHERLNFVRRTEGARSGLVESRVTTANELDYHLGALQAHLDDPSVTVYSSLYVAAIGRKPAQGK